MSFGIDRSVEVNAPAEVVWEVLTDFARYGEWNPFVVEAQCDLRPGGAIAMKVNLTGKPQAQTELIQSVEPGLGFSYNMKPMPLRALRSERSHRIEPLGAERCRYHSHFLIEGWLEGLVLKMFRAGLERGFAGMTGAIKDRAESLWAQRSQKRA